MKTILKRKFLMFLSVIVIVSPIMHIYIPITAFPLLSQFEDDNNISPSNNLPILQAESNGELAWLYTDDKNFVDENGTIYYLRGCNYEGLEWHGYQTGIQQSHLEQIKSWGFNVIRLPFTWEYLEPSYNVYDDAIYWAYIQQVIDWCTALHIYVLLDFHQWHWCRKYGSGYAGMPYWACWPDTATEARNAFITNSTKNGAYPEGLLGCYAEMWTHVASKYTTCSTILGYDLMNEPDFWTSNQLNTFYIVAADAIRSVEASDKHILFFEGGGGYAGCFGGIANYDNVAFANHGYFVWGGPYTGPTQTDGYGFTLETYTLSHLSSALNMPAVYGEYAYSASWSGANLYTKDQYDILDLYGISGTWWQCPIPNSGTGGMALVKTIDDAPRTPDPTFFDYGVDRPYVRKTTITPSTTDYSYSGCLWNKKTFTSFDLSTKHFTFITENDPGIHQLEIYVPSRFYPNGFNCTLTADNFDWTWDGDNRTLTLDLILSASSTIMILPDSEINVNGEEAADAPPTFSNLGTNTTLAGESCLFYTQWGDDFGLGGYIFGTNNTGTFINETWTDWITSPTSQWSNITKILNATDGMIVQFQFWCNDTTNQWSTTGTQFLTTTVDDVRIEVDSIVLVPSQSPTARVNVGTTVTLYFHSRYNNNQSTVNTGTLYINATGYAINSTGWATFTNSSSSVLSRSFTITGVDINGETDYQQIPPNPEIIWDRLEVYDSNVADTRANIGATVVFWWKVRYDYDDAVFNANNGTVQIGGIQATWSTSQNRWQRNVLLPSTVQNYSQALTFNDAMYGLTTITGTTTQYCVADKLTVTFASNATRVTPNSYVNVTWQIIRLFDSSQVSSFSLEMMRDTTNWGTFTNSSIIVNSLVLSYVDYTYDVFSIMDNTYTIDAFNSTSVNITWSIFTTTALDIYHVSLVTANLPYIDTTTATGYINTLSYVGTTLCFSAIGATAETSTTDVWCATLGKPISVLWDETQQEIVYNPTSNLVTVEVTHYSEEDVEITWPTIPATPSSPIRAIGNYVVLQSGTNIRTSTKNATFYIATTISAFGSVVDAQAIWIDKSYTNKKYTRYCLYVDTPNDVTLSINRWFTSTASSAELTITTPLETDIYLYFYSPDLTSASAIGVVTSTWNATSKVLFMLCNSNVNPIIIYAEATETEVNVSPENVALTITDMEGCGAWVFSESEYYTFQAHVWDGDGYGDIDQVKIAFDDGVHMIIAVYDATDGYSLEAGEDYVRLQAGTATALDDNLLQVTFLILFRNTILDAVDIDLYMGVQDDYGAWVGYDLMEGDYFSIYNLGGHSEMTSYSLAGRLLGGDVFDVYAYNSSSVAVGVQFRNLQHVKLCPEVNCTANTVTYALLYYMDYCTEDDVGDYTTGELTEGDWVRGWGVTMVLYSYTFGSERYIRMHVYWYNRGEQITPVETLYWYHEGTTADEPTRFRFWVDLWFNRINGSTTVGGRVSPYYYPMSDSSNVWLQWLSGSNWGIKQNVTWQSMFFDRLQNAYNETIAVSQIKMMRLRHGLYVYSDDPTTQYVTVSEYDIFDLTFGRDPLEGIQTPVFDPPVIPIMPQGGFLGPVWTILNGLYAAFRTGIDFLGASLGGWDRLVAFLDTIFTRFGWPPAFSILLGWIDILVSWVGEAVNFVVDFLVVALIFVGTAFGYMFNAFMAAWDGLTVMTSSLIWIWDSVSVNFGWVVDVIVAFVPLLAVFYFLWALSPLLDHFNIRGTRQRFEDTLGYVIKIVMFIWNVFDRLINWLFHLIEAVPVVE